MRPLTSRAGRGWATPSSAASRPRLVATDLDGTLLRNDETVSVYTKDVLARVAARVPIVLVTARPPRTARLLARAVGLDGILICCNGALTYDLASDTVVAHEPMPADQAQRLIRAIRAGIPGSTFAFELGLSYGREPGHVATIGHDQRLEDFDTLIGDALELCAVPVTKLIVRHPTHERTTLMASIAVVAGRDVQATHSGASFVELSRAGVDKASALAAYCAHRGIDPRDVVAFGDMPNDIPMLRWAGKSAAVANAHPDVLAATAEHVGSNMNDGVAHALEEWILAKGA